MIAINRMSAATHHLAAAPVRHLRSGSESPPFDHIDGLDVVEENQSVMREVTALVGRQLIIREAKNCLFSSLQRDIGVGEADTLQQGDDTGNGPDFADSDVVA